MRANDLNTRLQHLSTKYQLALNRSQCCANSEEWITHYIDAAACQFKMYQLTKEISPEIAHSYRTEAVRLIKDACKVMKEKNLIPIERTEQLEQPAPPKPVTPKPVPPKPVPPKPEKTDPEREAMLKELEGFDPAAARIWKISDDASFEDYGQMDDAVQSIVDTLEIMNGLRLRPDLAQKTREIKLNALLVGPPGGGKSHFCRAIGNYVMKTFNSPFYMVTASDIKHSHVGVAEKRIRALFNEVKKHGTDTLPVIIIDEIDSLCPDRNSSANNAAHVQSLVSEFLQCIDGVAGKTNAVIIGASNFPWLVDRALRSRLTRNAFLGLPSEGHIYNFLNKNIRQHLDKDDEVAREQLWACAAKFKNASYRNLNAFCNDVVTLSSKMTLNAHPQTSDFIPLSAEQLDNLCTRTAKNIEYNPRYIERLQNPSQWDEDFKAPTPPAEVSEPVQIQTPTEVVLTPENLLSYKKFLSPDFAKKATTKTKKTED